MKHLRSFAAIAVIGLSLALSVSGVAATTNDAVSAGGSMFDGMKEALQPLLDLSIQIGLNLILPVLGTVVAGVVAWAGTNLANVFGEQRANLIKQKITEALMNGLLSTAGMGAPGQPTFKDAVKVAVDHTKNAYAETIVARGIKDSALETMAGSLLSELIHQERAWVKDDPA